MSAATTLTGLRDIRGVEGSFLLRLPGGEVVARDGLQVISETALAGTARRLSNIFEALENVSAGPEEAVLRFEGMAIFARRNARVLLGVLAADNASMPALRMASQLVLRQLETLDLTVPAPPPATPPADPNGEKAAGGARRFWRGSPV